jgi:AcrR family transcriptional regulator
MRLLILDIAFKHFTIYGYQRTTLAGIANELGKGKSAIYYYFNNKEHIFNSIVEVEADNFLSELTKCLTAKTDEIARIKKYIYTRVMAMYQVAARYKLLKEELFVLLPEIEKARAPFHQKEIILLSKVLRDGIKKGMIKEMNEELAAKMLVNTLKGLEIPMFINAEFNVDATEIENLSNILLNGITTHNN